MRTCTLYGCNNKYLATGVCRKHYERIRNHGSLGIRRTNLFSDVVGQYSRWTDDGCRLWIGYKNDSGYGIHQTFGKIKRRNWRVHRLQWLLEGKPLGEDQLLDHTCPNRNCFNTEHLRLADSLINGQNRVNPNKNNTSGARGVSWCNSKQLWVAQVMYKRELVFHKRFEDFDEAHRAVIEARAIYHPYSEDNR